MAAVCMSLMTTGSDWWFGTFFYDFPHIGNVIIPTDEVIFFRGVETTNQGCNWNIWDISDFLLILPGGPWPKKVTHFTKCCLRLVVSPGLDESPMVI